MLLELGPRELGVEVHHHPDAPLGAALDIELAGTDQGHVAQPVLAGRRRRERAVQVVGGGEEDADQVVVIESVAIEHRLEQLQDPLGHVLLGVDVQGGGTPQGSHGA